MTDAPRILIVEDERVIARNLERRLVAYGYAIAGVTAYGEDAVHLAALHTPNLVLMDIRLKGEMDGICAAEEIRALDIPVIFLTAHADDVTLRAAKVTEPFGYVLKPFEERELRIVIEMALYKHAAERERARLEEQARRSEKIDALGRLAGGIAHDFNNVLMVILNTCAILLRQTTDAPITMRVALIRGAAERAARMTRQLLMFGRERTHAVHVYDTGELLRGIVGMLSQLIGEDVTIETQIEPDVGAIEAMPWHVEQIILNLVVNARDAMPDGGKVIVSAENAAMPDREKHILIRVGDNGRGMDAETRARMFEPFFTTKGAGEGGMGLATVYRLVREAGGKIEVVSTVGKGSEFMIWLPASEQRATAAVAADELALVPAFECNVMVVEDDHLVRGLIRDILEAAGATVLEAIDGAEALQLCHQHDGPIDVVVTDVVMPRMNGVQLAGHLASARPATKVLYMSGYPDRSGAQPSELTPLLAKPFTPTQLLDSIRKVLEPSS